MKKYDIIYADPPWQYKVWSKKGAGRSAEIHYQTESAEFLKKMNIQALCKPNCTLFMWVAFPFLEQALELGRAWGFTYKTVAFTWVKTNINNENPFMGMGYYTRSNTEIVLLFTKGKPLARLAKNVPQVLISPRARHSEKPDEIRKRIVRLFGDVTRLELFARQNSAEDNNTFKGWDVFGNEVHNSIEIPK
ncbi:MT-A70 family methyltransferase [Flavobacterium sp. FlaQc-28]|uniref:MT-A70 family methyltransferase n=1 Tax=Flavobacterium sp. FlaQc-28 TaxID=3374178 RepID=UPI003757B62D